MSEPPASFRPFRAPRPLRGSFVQSALATVKLRRAWISVRHPLPAPRPVVLDCDHGVRLLALHDPRKRRVDGPRGIVVLFHGWEGGARSTYMESSRRALLDDGWEVYRLNFRDHGGTHALNPDLFHSCRIREVVDAVVRIATRHPGSAPHLVGFSLGGNFALRVALRAPGRGLRLASVTAVNPVVDPARTLDALERGPRAIERHFVRKWRASMKAKARAFPGRFDLDAWMRLDDLRSQTRHLIERYTEFPTLAAYLDGYSIAGDRLRGLEVSAQIITARDDPVIPVEDVLALPGTPHLTVEVQPRGGHCGFVESLTLRSWIDARIRHRLRRETSL